MVGMKSYCLLNRLFLLGIVLFLSGCVSIKPGGVKSGKNLVETFFVGDDGTQYFIKPLLFKSETNQQLIIDFTFRYKDRIKDSAFVNMSFLNTEIIKNVDSLKIISGNNSMVLENVKSLFVEKIQSEYKSRYSTKGSLSDIDKLFNNNDWTILVYRQNNISRYITPKETKKKIGKLNESIFVLF